MTEINIPEGYNHVMPYLIIEHPEKFLEFTQTVFAATEKMKVMRDEHTIMHAEVVIGDSCIMFAGATEEFAVQNAGLYINVANADETYKTALANGATEVMPPSDREYGRSGGVKDPCGNTWWITSTPR